MARANRLLHPSLSAKLWTLVIVSIVALVSLGAFSIFSAREIRALGQTLHDDSSTTQKFGTTLQVAAQQMVGGVRAAPAELDLDVLKASRDRMLALARSLKDGLIRTAETSTAGGIRASAAKTAAAIDAFNAAAARVFDLSFNFAQAEAIAVLNSAGAPAEAALRAALDEFARAADAEAAARIADMQERTDAVARMAVVVVGLLVAGLAAFSYAVVSRGVSRPIVSLNRVMMKLAGGTTDADIPYAGRHDEIGDMARAVEVFKKSMLDARELRAEQEAAGQRAEAEKRSAMGRMADEFEASIKAVARVVLASSGNLQKTAQSMTATAEEASRRSAIVAAASGQASVNVETVASAAEQLSSSISEISHQVSESARITGQAVKEAERTNTQVQALADAAQRIGEVVKLINAIAAQTNLLALNATIEAARAGEAGKGFAVVASEVKGLAGQTARATEEIAGQVKAIQTATTDSIDATRTIGETIGRINEIAGAIAAAVEEQGAATREIARNVQQASSGTREVSSNIASVTKASSDTGSAAALVLEAAGDLARESDSLAGQVDAFIAKIRSA